MNKYLFFLGLFLSLIGAGCIPDPISDEDIWKKDVEKIEEYLDKEGLTAQSTASGLHYIIEEPGAGGNPASDDEVTVFYKGYLLDETVFDQTATDPVTFRLDNLILGWQEGIPLLQKGGKGKFFLPSALGYGRSGAGNDVPPNSVLIFEIELVNF